MGEDGDDEHAREAEAQRRIADACLGDGADGEFASGRLGLYRRLIQGNLAAVARRLLPRTARALDLQGAGVFDGWFARFLAEAGPRTPYLRDVPVEFVAWASVHWEGAAGIPLFLPDLARHEIDLFLIESAPGDASSARPRVGEVDPGRPLVFATPWSLVRYEHAVDAATETPLRRVTHMLIHRDDENTVHARVVAESNVKLLTLLLDRMPLAEALRQTGAAAAEKRLVEVAAWLAELGETRALLGGEGGEEP